MRVQYSDFSKLSQEANESYDKNGFVLVEDMYSAEETSIWKSEAKGHLNQDLNPDSSGVCVWWANQAPPHILEAVCSDRIVNVLENLIGEEVEFLSVKTVFKSGEVSFETPWHQDYAYWGGSPKISVWIALEDATPSNGCLKVIPGSHKKFLNHGKFDPKKFENRISDEDVAGKHVESVPMKLGSALFFSDKLIHASHPNLEKKDRWCFIPTYRNSAVNDESTTWSESIPLRKVG